MTGAVIWGLTYDQVFPLLSKIGNYGNVTMPDLWNLNPYLFIMVFALICLLLFYLIDRAGLQRKKE